MAVFQHHRFSGPQHEQAQIDPNDIPWVFYIRNDKQSAFIIALWQLAFNHCLSSDLQCKTVVATCLPIMTSQIARSKASNGSGDFKIVFYVNPDFTADTVPVGTMLLKDSASDIVLRHRLINTKHTTDNQ